MTSAAKFSLLEFLRSFNTGGKRDGLIELLIQSHAKQINLLGALKELAVAARDFDGEVDKYEKLSNDFSITQVFRRHRRTLGQFPVYHFRHWNLQRLGYGYRDFTRAPSGRALQLSLQ